MTRPALPERPVHLPLVGNASNGAAIRRQTDVVIVRSLAGRRATVLAWAAICGIVVFNLGWLVAGALQAGAYSVATDDVSDLGALTATDPWVMLTTSGIAGLATILFALLALRPALAVVALGSAIGAWLLALSLMGLDNLSDVFFDSTAVPPTRVAPWRRRPARAMP